LAECPEGIDFGPRPSGRQDAPFTLCPLDPAAAALVDDLFAELLPHFPHTNLVHIGCDETLDLGKGRSQAAVAERGLAAVYLDFLCRIARKLQAAGHTPMFWADILQGFDGTCL
jgi:hexosaminidase